MTKTQLDNLIKFAFNFHITMGLSLEQHSSDYILEKWNKYIGVKPISLDLPSAEVVLANKHQYNIFLIKWLETWHRKNEYDSVKEIINFILILNVHFFPSEEHQKRWNVTNLVSAFSKNVGDPNLINKDPYNHLHALIMKKVDSWLEDKEIQRDYKLNTLVQ